MASRDDLDRVLRENAALIAILLDLVERLRGDPRYRDIVERVDAWSEGREWPTTKRKN